MKRSASRDANATSLAGGHHLHTDAGELSLPGFHLGHPLQKDRRLVDGLAHEDRARGRRPGDGAMEAQTIRGTRTSFRSRRQVQGDLVRQVPRRGRPRSFDGKDGDRPGQRAMAESFIATLKTELVHRRRFPDREVTRSAIFEYLEGFYNRRRLHSALSYQSP
jgi:transposase InsO family protein